MKVASTKLTASRNKVTVRKSGTKKVKPHSVSSLAVSTLAVVSPLASIAKFPGAEIGALHGDPEICLINGELPDEGREELVLKYRVKARKLSRSILRKWHARLDAQEVDSVVDLSLCEAVRRFNPTKGASFMTFMYFHLRGNLIRAVAGAVQEQALPMFEENEVTGYAAEIDNSAAGQVQQRAPKVSDVVTAFYGDERLLPDEMIYKKELSRLIHEGCDGLDHLEREVVERLFFKEHQLLDIADSLGYSRCHISRVKKRALEVLGRQLSTALPHLQAMVVAEEEEEDIVSDRNGDRRPIRRRRPRSKKSVKVLPMLQRA